MRKEQTNNNPVSQMSMIVIEFYTSPLSTTFHWCSKYPKTTTFVATMEFIALL